MKRKFWLICYILFFFLFIQPASIFAQSQFNISPSSFDLGKLQEGKVYKYEIIVDNKDDSSLEIESFRSSCGCLKVLEPKGKFSIKPRSSAKIRFSLDTTGYRGEMRRFIIYLHTNRPRQPLFKISVDAEIVAEEEVFLERFRSFNLGMIVGAGLLDGINPCAFTVLVFFVSFLSFVGYRKREMLIVGSFFIISVFVTYLLIGLGIFEFFRKMEIFFSLSRFLYLAVAIFVFLLGGVSLYDWWVYKKTGDSERIKLRLPDLIKRQIQRVIRQKTDIRAVPGKMLVWKLILVSLSAGFLVSLLESVCTGQLYLPTIVYVLKMPIFKMKALSYLLLYNLMFVLPLMLIFYLGLRGVSSEEFAQWIRRHLSGIKLLTAFIFFLLGLSLLAIKG